MREWGCFEDSEPPQVAPFSSEAQHGLRRPPGSGPGSCAPCAAQQPGRAATTGRPGPPAAEGGAAHEVGGGEGPRAAAPRGACSCLGGRRWRREHQVIPTGARVTGDARPGCCPTRRRSFPDHRREKTILLLVTGCLPSPLKDMVTSSLLAPDRGLCRRDPAGRVTWRLVRRTLTWGGRRPR